MRRLLAPFRWFAGTRLARSLRFRLILIVLIASLPALGLLFLTASQQRQDALAAGQEEAERLAQIAASDQGREMDRTEREVTLLARLPEIQGGDASACTGLFQRLVNDPDNAIYVDLRVLGTDGSVVCRSSAAEPLTEIDDSSFIEDAFSGVPFTVGPYLVDTLTGQPVISFAAPVRTGEGAIDRVIVAMVDLESQSTFLTQGSLPEGAIIRIVDNEGNLLLQRPPDPAQVGTSLRGTPVVDAVVAGQGRPGSAAPIENDDYVYATRKVSMTSTNSVTEEASVIVQLPEAEIVRRANDAFQDNLGKLGVAAAIVVFAAWISADLFIARDSETRKSIVAELYHSYSTGAVEHLESIVAPEFVDHSPAPEQAPGIDGMKQVVAAFRSAFPDGEIVPREILADRDKVVARVSLTGTHLGEFQGIAPSGKRMIANGTETFRFESGLIVESWSLFGPLVEMKRLTSPETRKEPPRRKRGFFQRLFGRGKDIPPPEQEPV
jgi:predicted ester cyclase